MGFKITIPIIKMQSVMVTWWYTDRDVAVAGQAAKGMPSSSAVSLVYMIIGIACVRSPR